MPRAGLDADRVLDAAARIADAEGLGALTIARLAAELKVKPPSLYNHVESLDALRDGLARRGLRELLDESLDAVAGRAGRDALEALAHAQRRYAKAHPGLYTALQLDVAGRDPDTHVVGARYVEVVLAVLRGYGLGGDDALHVTRALRAAVRGFVDLELGGGFGLPLELDRSFDVLLDLLDAGFRARAARRPASDPA